MNSILTYFSFKLENLALESKDLTSDFSILLFQTFSINMFNLNLQLSDECTVKKYINTVQEYLLFRFRDF